MKDRRSNPISDSKSAVAPAEGGHLIIIGGGGAGFAAALKASELGGSATLINQGLPMGGTCVNVGCVPSKTLIRAAEALHRASHPPAFAGIVTSGRLADFRSLIAQKSQLISELRQARYANVIAGNDKITFLNGQGRLVDTQTVEFNGSRLRGDAVLIATGSRPRLPSIPGLAEVGCLTSESVFELNELPESVVILGGRYVALELAQMLSRFGVKVTILQRSERILPSEASDLTDELTRHLESEGISVETAVTVDSISRRSDGICVIGRVAGEAKRFCAARVVAATGRLPNTEELGLKALGVATDPAGHVSVNEDLSTNVPHVYAAGDVIGEPMFVYTAAYEGALAAANALGDADRPRDYTGLPWVIFTDPQVGGVGLDLDQANSNGFDAEASTVPLSQVPRAIAARDTRGFIRLIRDRKTDRLLGARILAPEGSELLMEAALAIRHRIPVCELATAFHPYLTLGEGVKLAALAFRQDVAKLSCCAS